MLKERIVYINMFWRLKSEFSSRTVKFKFVLAPLRLPKCWRELARPCTFCDNLNPSSPPRRHPRTKADFPAFTEQYCREHALPHHRWNNRCQTRRLSAEKHCPRGLVRAAHRPGFLAASASALRIIPLQASEARSEAAS